LVDRLVDQLTSEQRTEKDSSPRSTV